MIKIHLLFFIMGNLCGVSTTKSPQTIPNIPTVEMCVEYLPTKGYMVDVYDGDTFTLAVLLENRWTKWPVRVTGIDCPELRTKNPNEKQIAVRAKEYVLAFKGKEVQLKNVSREKYGRLLAEVHVDELNIGEELLSRRMAVRYDGGTKQVPSDWVSYYEKGAL